MWDAKSSEAGCRGWSQSGADIINDSFQRRARFPKIEYREKMPGLVENRKTDKRLGNRKMTELPPNTEKIKSRMLLVFSAHDEANFGIIEPD